MAALDWLHEQTLRCSGCGFPLDETTDPDADGAYIAEPVTCHACFAQAGAAKQVHPDFHAGLLFRTRRDD